VVAVDISATYPILERSTLGLSFRQPDRKSNKITGIDIDNFFMIVLLSF